MPCSVMLNPAMVRSKLKADFSVTGNNHVGNNGVDKDYDNKNCNFCHRKSSGKSI
jgi:hypothetical protein